VTIVPEQEIEVHRSECFWIGNEVIHRHCHYSEAMSLVAVLIQVALQLSKFDYVVRHSKQITSWYQYRTSTTDHHL
jgi:hypothetical protein